ncbi:hypothetical protein [Salinispira pacifica]
MNIEELTRKIYDDGVVKAQGQAEDIVAKARKEADRIVAEANRSADQVRAKAQEEAKATRQRVTAELRLAGEQAVSDLRARVSALLVDATLPESVDSALSDPGFMQELLRETVDRWDPERTNTELVALVPEERLSDLQKYFAAKAKNRLEKGLSFTPGREVKRGFEIAAKDGSFKVSFTEEDFVAFFRGFLREATRKILFPEPKSETSPKEEASR